MQSTQLAKVAMREEQQLGKQGAGHIITLSQQAAVLQGKVESKFKNPGSIHQGSFMQEEVESLRQRAGQLEELMAAGEASLVTLCQQAVMQQQQSEVGRGPLGRRNSWSRRAPMRTCWTNPSR